MHEPCERASAKRKPDVKVIRTVNISNYRSCLETSFELQPDLSVLIGPNGSGKTNVLHALLLLRELTAEPAVRPHDEPAVDKSRLKVKFQVEDKTATVTSDVELFTDDNNADRIVNSEETWYARDFTKKRARIKIPLWFGRYLDRSSSPSYNIRMSVRASHYFYSYKKPTLPDSFVPCLISISRYLSDIKYYSASQFTNPSRCPVSFLVETGRRLARGASLRGHGKFLFDLFREYKERETSNYEKFLSVIGREGIGLVDRIDFKEILTSSIEYSVRSGGRVRKEKRQKVIVIPQFIIGRNSLSPSQLSEGTFKSITLLFYLMTERSSALLIEEPEVCVHHGLLSSIVELIKTYSREKQIVLSTHSDFVLDQIEPRHVYRVTRDHRTGTSVTQIAKALPAKELTALKQYLETQGNLGEYWRHGGLD
jgi:ABC-type lipoprotein export system ATPase subunit